VYNATKGAIAIKAIAPIKYLALFYIFGVYKEFGIHPMDRPIWELFQDKLVCLREIVIR